MGASQQVVQLSAASLARRVDQLGELNAQISALESKAKKIKQDLIKSGFAAIDGKRYKAVVSTSVQTRLDSALVKSVLTVQQIADCSVQSTRTSICLYDK